MAAKKFHYVKDCVSRDMQWVWKLTIGTDIGRNMCSISRTELYSLTDRCWLFCYAVLPTSVCWKWLSSQLNVNCLRRQQRSMNRSVYCGNVLFMFLH